MICLNLSFATMTSRLTERRSLSRASCCRDRDDIHSFQSSDFQTGVLLSVFNLNVLLLSDNEMLSLQNKKGWNKSAAVQFVKKDWGTFRTSLRLMTRGSLLQLLQSSWCNVSSKDKKLKKEKKKTLFFLNWLLSAQFVIKEMVEHEYKSQKILKL